MKILKNAVISLALIGVIGYCGFSLYLSSLSPCDKPLEYGIGRFDNQFGVSKEDFKVYIAEAETVWEKTLGRDIFLYDPDADFKINLIYDERQLTTIQKQKTEFGLVAVEETFKKLDANFSIFKSEYDQKVFSYGQSLVLYQKRKSAYDAEVKFWNSKGGAPENKYDSLEAERRYLNTEAAKLNAETSSITTMGKQLNSLLNERNAKATEYNKIAAEYNKKYGGGLEFNQAEYIESGESGLSFLFSGVSRQINVYQFGNKKDLVLALAHELGHALGMSHVENPKSIMYYLTGANTEFSITPSAEDLSELKKVCSM